MATKTTEVSTATAKPNQMDLAFEEYGPQIQMALPAHMQSQAGIDRFKRIVITSINQNPELWTADRRSLFTSCVACAQDGLMPDGRDAALVIFNTKNKATDQWDKKVQYMPMISGIRKRMRNSGDVLSAVAEVVYENDRFDYRLGDEPYIEHKPALSDRGKRLGAYAIIKLKNGEVLREYMDVDELDQVKAVSKSGDKGPWGKWWGEMARKTVLRRCAKSAPTSSEDERVLSRVDTDDPYYKQLDQAPAAPAIAPPQRPVREDFDPKDAGHADLDEEYRQVAGEVVTEDGEVIEEGEADEPVDDSEVEGATDNASGNDKPVIVLPELPRRPNKTQWGAWAKAAETMLKTMTKAEAGEFEKEYRDHIGDLNQDQPELAGKLVDVLNERITQPDDDEPQGELID